MNQHRHYVLSDRETVLLVDALRTERSTYEVEQKALLIRGSNPEHLDGDIWALQNLESLVRPGTVLVLSPISDVPEEGRLK